MPDRFRRWSLLCLLANRAVRRRHGAWVCRLITFSLALLIPYFTIHMLERQLQPTVAEIARIQVENAILTEVEQAAHSVLLTQVPPYEQLVSIQRDERGQILSMQADWLAINRLRSELLEDLLDYLSSLDVHKISIPMGSLFHSEVFWGRGPEVRVNALSVGNISAEFESQFTGAGVNQTLHRILLHLEIPATVLLPLCKIDVNIETAFCVLETVIIGQVPGVYLPGSA